MTGTNGTERMDLRVQRTYKLLSSSFEQLLKKRSYNQITVQEICEAAMVRRTTFYQHFTDKHHFLVWFLKNKQQVFIAENFPFCRQNSFRECFTSIMTRLLTFLKQNREIIESLSSCGLGDPNPIDDLVDSCVAELNGLFSSFPEAHLIPSDIPVSLATNYYMGAVKAAAGWWFKGGCTYPEDRLAAHIYELFRTDPTLAAQARGEQP